MHRNLVARCRNQNLHGMISCKDKSGCVGVLFLQFKEMPLCVGSLVLRVARRGDIQGDVTPCCEPGKKGSENTPVSECDCSTSAGSLLLSQVKSSAHRVVVEVGGGQLEKERETERGMAGRAGKGTREQPRLGT